MMFIETYLTAVFMCSEHGNLICWLTISFMFSLLTFAVVALTTYAVKKKQKKLTWPHKLLLTEAYLLIAWIILFLYHEISIQAITIPILYGLAIFLFLITPLTLVYQKIMTRYPMLPWHFVQYFICLTANLVFWALAVYQFQVFAPFI